MHAHTEIELDAAEVGMALAQDVTNAAGLTLAAAGMVLTQNMLDGLRARGVTQLHVHVKQDAAEQSERIAFLFRKAEGDPLRAALRRALERYRSQAGTP